MVTSTSVIAVPFPGAMRPASDVAHARASCIGRCILHRLASVQLHANARPMSAARTTRLRRATVAG